MKKEGEKTTLKRSKCKDKKDRDTKAKRIREKGGIIRQRWTGKRDED